MSDTQAIALEQKAHQAMAAGDANSAFQALSAALATAPSQMVRARLLNQFGRLQIAMNATLGAAAAFGEAHALTGDPQMAQMQIQCLVGAGKIRKGLAVLKTLPPSILNTFAGLYLHADILRRAGHWAELVPIARAGLKLNPGSRNMQLTLATALGHLNQWEEANALFANLEGHSGLAELKAGALVETGRVDEAMALLRKALDTKPEDVSLQKALAMISWMKGERETFADRIMAVSDARPDDVMLAMAAADLLRRAGRTDEALDRLRKTRARIDAPVSMVDSAIGIMLSNLGQHAEGVRLTAAAANAAPGVDWMRRNAACAALAAGAFPEALAHTNWGIASDPEDQEWIALDTVAKRGANDPAWRRIYDYDRFVSAADLPVPPGYADLDAFLAALARHLREMHMFSEHPLDQSLRGGSQLILNPNIPHAPVVESLFGSLKTAWSGYLQKIGNSLDHPYTRKNTGSAKMSGCWSVRLTTGGSHVNHIHSDGWISSAFYVTVPKSVTENSNTKAGWLTFGEPRFKVPGIVFDHSVQPKPGRLALFPSYMWHGVLPFDEGEERMTVAFDLIPA